MRRSKRSICIGAVSVCLVAPATSMADSGTYESVTSLVTNYIKSERGDEVVTGGSSSGTITITRSSGGLFPEGSSTLLDCIVFAKKSSKGIDLEAPCTQTDSAGDKLFVLAKRRAGDVTGGTSGNGTTEITGGTGKFAGTTGKCTYKIDYLSDKRVVSISSCRWERP